MNIHTLGPEHTDCYEAASKLICVPDDKIICYESFDRIINELGNLIGEFVLFPAAFQSAKSNYGWKEFNFQYWDRLELVKVFSKETKPMVLVKNRNWKQNIAVIHPATEIFINEYIKKTQESIKIVYSDSKFKAWNQFLENEMKYTIISKDVLRLNNNRSLIIVNQYNPIMVWCLYKIRRATSDKLSKANTLQGNG